jgi:lipopolysaccharide transport system ATP-binding protein
MSPEPVIQVEGISKRYQIGVRRKHNRLLEQLADAVRTPFRRIRSFGRSSYRSQDSIWALKNVSFEVYPGEVLGLIGANGAGKSTLLKILSRITCPTEGQAVLRGRVGSLLEIGTGFHGELTGRENIYVSGAILGMQKEEIRRQFDAIVSFAGVEKYLDTPVKRYSSGMRVRLGFAVAAHLQPEILLIDEVLAVGDAEFQAKCLGRMDSIARGGRTILFVSHNLEAMQQLCPRSLLLEDGRLVEQGDTPDLVRAYLDSGADRGGHLDMQQDAPKANVHTAQWFSPSALRVLADDGSTTDRVRSDRPFTIEVEYELLRRVHHMQLTLEITTHQGERIAVIEDSSVQDRIDPGACVSRCHVPAGLFSRGVLRLGLDVREPRTKERYHCPALISVCIDTAVLDPSMNDRALIRPCCRWEFHQNSQVI